MNFSWRGSSSGTYAVSSVINPPVWCVWYGVFGFCALQNPVRFDYHRRIRTFSMLMTQHVLPLTLPSLFGYIPLGIAFAVLSTSQLDYAWWIVPLMALVT